MFLNTLGVTEKVARTAIKKSDENGVLEKDMRGSTKNRKYSEDVTNEVKEHIKSFLVMEAHYVREQCKRSYLSSNLNLATIYDLYYQTTCTSRRTNIETFLTPTLIWAFINRKNTGVRFVSSLKMLLLTNNKY